MQHTTLSRPREKGTLINCFIFGAKANVRYDYIELLFVSLQTANKQIAFYGFCEYFILEFTLKSILR